jgi:phosphoribosylamine--glycine ligase
MIAETRAEASAAIDAMFTGTSGVSGQGIVIEEFLDGEEVSYFVLSDGDNCLPFGAAQDHKRVGEGDVGPNTGGMGAYSPVGVFTPELERQTLDRIIRPTILGMKARGRPYKGALYAGLMLTKEGPKLIEYNARFGDPECQVLMMRLKSDIVALMLGVVDGVLGSLNARFDDGAALTVVMATKGYPGATQKGSVIRGLEKASVIENVVVFHAGTAIENGSVIASGGRVLNLTARGKTVAEANARAYQAVKAVDWPEGFCRQDIGWRAIGREHR